MLIIDILIGVSVIAGVILVAVPGLRGWGVGVFAFGLLLGFTRKWSAAAVAELFGGSDSSGEHHDTGSDSDSHHDHHDNAA